MSWEPQVIRGGVAAAPKQSPDVEQRLDIDLKAEAAVLSSVLNDEMLLDEVRVWLRKEHFYSEAHQRIFEATCALRDSSTPVDVVTVMTHLRANDRLKQVGSDYMITVTNAAPALGSARCKAYALAVRDAWARAQMHAVYNNLQSKSLVEPMPVETLINEGREHLDRLSIELGKSEKDASIREVLKRTTKRLEAIAASGGRGQLPTGIDRLDRILGGLQQTLIVIAARPGMGKTSLATKIAVNVASRTDDAGVLANGVYLSSLETFDEEACTRLWCAEARVAVTKARGGKMSKEDWANLLKAAEWIARLPLKIDDDAAESVTSLWSKCRRADMLLQREGKKLKLVVVDYLQLLKAPRAGMKSREEVVSENTRQLLAMSNDLKCSVIALAQLNRDCEKRPNKRPVLSDLRESGEIENAARVVCFLYRDEYYNKDSEERNIAEIIVAKQNNGPTDTVRVRFDGVYTRFDNLAEDELAGSSSGSGSPPPGFYEETSDSAYEPPRTVLSTSAAAPPESISEVRAKPKELMLPPVPPVPPQQVELLPPEREAKADPDAVAPKRKNGKREPKKRSDDERYALSLVVATITPDMTIVELRHVLGKTKGLSVRDVDRFVTAGVEDGLVTVTGEGNERRLRRAT